jgi:hypothetical protein
MNRLHCLVLLTLVGLSMSVDMVDLAGKFQNYTCLKEQGFDRAIIRAYHSYGAIDQDAPSNIKLSN